MIQTIEDRLNSLESLTDALKEQPKAFAMIFAAIFGALSENPETIKKIIELLQTSLATANQQGAHIVVLSELSRTVTLLTVLLNAKH